MNTDVTESTTPTTTRLGVALLLLALALRVALYLSGAAHINVSGDESIIGLQAIGITEASESAGFQAKQHPPGLFGRFPLLFMAQPYLFPIESYLAAPLIRLLPHSAYGIRFTPFLMGLGALALTLALLRRIAGGAAFRAGAVLALFPSAYMLTVVSAYPLPSYPSFILFTALTLWLAQRQKDAPSLGSSAAWAAACGLSAGLAVSGSLMAIPLSGGVLAMVLLNGSWRRGLVSAPPFLLAAAAGLSPFFIAKVLYPGAYGAVSQTVPVAEALTRLWSPAVNFTLPIALGLRAPVVADAVEIVGLVPTAMIGVLGALWALLMIVITIRALIGCVKRGRAQRWPDFEVGDVAVGLTWAALLLFILSSRFGSHEFRYLLPIGLYLPIIVAAQVRELSGRKACFGVIAAGGLSAINVATAVTLATTWWSHSFDGYFTDVRPAIQYMRGQGITHCYASYFDCYAINYLGDENPRCAQPFNERFYTWPHPYVADVDAANNGAYALGPSQRFRRTDFEVDLWNCGVAYHASNLGKVRVFHDFAYTNAPAAQPVARDELTVRTSHTPETAAALIDGDSRRWWRAAGFQEDGMWIELRNDRLMQLDHLVLHYDGYPHDPARGMRVEVEGETGWEAVAEGVPFKNLPFVLSGGKPVYSAVRQPIALGGRSSRAVRLVIDAVNPQRAWTLGEIELFEATP